MPGSSTGEAKFHQIFHAHFEAINRYCLRRIRVSEVNDVVAEVFTVAWRKVDLMPEGEDTLPWLYGVARNELRNRRRSLRRHRALNDRAASRRAAPDAGPEPIVVAHSEYSELMDALATLHPDDQELLLLRTHEELDYKMIASAIGSNPEAVRKRISRALQRLRRAAGIPTPESATSISRAIKEGGDK